MSYQNESKSASQDRKLYYDQRWSITDLFIDRKCRARFIIPNIERIRIQMGRPLRICDLGCGTGWLSALVSKYGDVLGVDMNIETAKRLYPELKFIQADLTKEKIEGRYDVVLSSLVIEWLEAQYQPIYVKQIYELLEPDGYVVLTTTNKPKMHAIIQAQSIGTERLHNVGKLLDKNSLFSLLQPYFIMEVSSTVMFSPTIVNKYRPLGFMYTLLYDKAGFYKPFDKIFTRLWDGLYLAIAAKKAVKDDRSA